MVWGTDDPLSAYSLPGRYYFDPEIYKQEQEKIFYRTWQYVCHISRLESPGSFLVRDIGDQSVVVIRGKDGKIRAFHNVCQHRAHRLLEGSGSVSYAIVCPYHLWTYELTGELRQALHSGRRVYSTAVIAASHRWPEAVAGAKADFVFIDSASCEFYTVSLLYALPIYLMGLSLQKVFPLRIPHFQRFQ